MSIDSQIRSLVGEELRTVRGRPFRVNSLTGATVLYEANGNIRPGQLRAYEMAIAHVDNGGRIKGPADLQRLHPQDRNTAYQFAVLRRLGIVS